MALTFLKIEIFEQGFVCRLISTSILSIYRKIMSPEPLTEKRPAKKFSDLPLSPLPKSPSSYLVRKKNKLKNIDFPWRNLDFNFSIILGVNRDFTSIS